MKLAKHIFILIASLLCSVAAYAQSAESALKFTSLSHDFGHISEEGGEVQCTFSAKNEGNNEIFVSDITTSCGCTSASYSKEGIAPGSTFVFTVKFNPYNRPGRTDKHIFVTTSDSEEVTKLLIKGYVQERERTIDEIYPYDMGQGLRIRTIFHAFGYIEQGNSADEQLGFINTSDKALIINIDTCEESGILSIEYPTTIPAGATGDITLRYEMPLDHTTYGTISDKMILTIDGHEARYKLSSEAIATDNFSMVDDISAPHIDISKKIIKFGEIKSNNEVLEEVVVITNSGASPLMLRSIESSSKALECVASSYILQQSESATLSISLHTERITATEGLYLERLRIITNDPTRPMQSIKVNAIID